MKNWIVKLLINAVAVFGAAYLMPSVHVSSFMYAILVALVLALLNASIRPLLVFFTLPATIFSFGLFLLFINTVIIKLADWLLDGFSVDSWWAAFFFSVLLWAINSILEKIIEPDKMLTTQEPSTKIYDKDGNRIA